MAKSQTKLLSAFQLHKGLVIRSAFSSLIFLLLHSVSLCQFSLDSLSTKIAPSRFSEVVAKRAARLEKSLARKNDKMLSAYERACNKIKDSSKRIELTRGIGELKNSLRSEDNSKVLHTYLPMLDSLQTGLKFISASGSMMQVREAIEKTKSLQSQFQHAEDIKKFIRDKKALLKDELDKLGLFKQMKKLNKEVYYYSAQLNEYKETLKDPNKIEKKVLELLSKNKKFQEFFKKNSLLASLFRMPGDPADPVYLASLQGLQTRAQVNALIQQQVMAGGTAGMAQFRQNLQSAQADLAKLKNKVLQLGGRSSDAELPSGFKPNEQKTKTFFQRLELGTNMQSQKSTGILPVRSDIGISVGYKLNQNSVIGFGGSYKLGWGKGWQHIKLSSEGLSLRSFIDWKIKGSFYVSGGYEMNYNSSFSAIPQWADAWQKSGLIGLSRQLPLRTKFFKKTKLMLFWDFLSYEQVPKGQPVIFRVGYNLK